MSSWSALIVPAMERGRGSGHLKRCAALASSLRDLGKEAFLFLDGAASASMDRAEAMDRFAVEPGFVFSGDPASRPWTLVVLDRFRTPAREFSFWSAIAPVVGIDEGGPRRTSFDYLLDLLPALPSVPPPNRTAPELLDAPRRRRTSFPRAHVSGRAPLRVLVTFGGEDAAGLSLPAAKALSADGRASVDLLRGALSPGFAPTEGVRLLEPVADLKELLADYDLVVTQYGLTAFEAARARVPVLLVSPTRYHERLARAAGFRSAGVGAKAALRVRAALDSLSDLIERTAAAVPPGAEDSPETPGTPLARHIASLSFPAGAACPLCAARSASSSKVLARFPERTYRRCASCGLLFLTRTNPPPIVYAREYFFEDYKKQYGKTYLEDFPNLERAGRDRVRRVAALIKQPLRGSGPARLPRILDIGCAYGPFLAAARSEGFSPYGIDPAADAVRFVREELGIPAAAGLFPETDPAAVFGVPSFDAVSLWYVIEHFPQLGEALRNASRLLGPGGVLAFSTPSGSGVSGRVRRLDFLERSPADHFSIWEPGRTAALLRRFGFRLAKIVVAGHHPERFPGLSGARKGDLLYAKAMIASRLFGLGDTYEAYAVKESDSL